MRILVWIFISLAIHIITFYGYNFFKQQIKEIEYRDLSYIQLNEPQRQNQPIKELVKPIKPLEKQVEPDPFGEKPPVSNTNAVQQQYTEVETDGTGNTDGAYYSEYMPYYQVEEYPVPLSKIETVFPEDARRLQIEGTVILEIYIDEKGIIHKINIKKSPHEYLSTAASNAINKIRFRPAKINGKPCAVIASYTLRYRLE